MVPHDDYIWLIKKFLNPMTPLPVTDIEVRTRPLAGIKALLIDLYGTLLISGTGDGGITNVHTNQYPASRLLEEQGCTLRYPHFDDRITELLYREIKKQTESAPPYSEADIIEAWHGTIDHLVDDQLIYWNYTQEDLVKLSLTYEMTVNPVWPMPGALSFLQKCSGRFVMGSIINGQFHTPLMFEALFENNMTAAGFDHDLIFLSSLTGRTKPSPELFETVRDRLEKNKGIAADQVLVIGNSYVNDIVPAGNAGFRTALFCGDSRSFQREVSGQSYRFDSADCIVRDFESLYSLISSLSGSKP